jgi:hypothetical protein
MATTQRGIGFFSKEKQAEQAIRALESAQFPMDQVSIVAKELQEDTVAAGAKTGHTLQGQDVNNPQKRPEQANASAFWGGLVGGLSAIAFPGAGSVFAVGAVGTALATVAAGQGAGAAASFNLARGLQSLGVPEAKSGHLSDRLINGDYMVVVDSDSEAMQQAASVLTDQDIQAWDVYTAPTA